MQKGCGEIYIINLKSVVKALGSKADDLAILGAKKSLKGVSEDVRKGTQVNSKTMWKGKGKDKGRIDVENPNPSQRSGQVHYQDNKGKKYIYDPITGQFKDAPNRVNDLLKNSEFKRGIEKGLKYLEH
ncbi:MAG: hypothetical protein IPL35_14715 [Sphingobacteriales bacterium]|nr:hypothetical protein [Sphingobacteriales bacterium]